MLIGGVLYDPRIFDKTKKKTGEKNESPDGGGEIRNKSEIMIPGIPGGIPAWDRHAVAAAYLISSRPWQSPRDGAGGEIATLFSRSPTIVCELRNVMEEAISRRTERTLQPSPRPNIKNKKQKKGDRWCC